MVTLDVMTMKASNMTRTMVCPLIQIRQNSVIL